jgi:hypothetical protein
MQPTSDDNPPSVAAGENVGAPAEEPQPVLLPQEPEGRFFHSPDEIVAQTYIPTNLADLAADSRFVKCHHLNRSVVSTVPL